MKGWFITFEGVEGCGKTTQVERLSERLAAAGHRVTTLREPGGTAVGEAVRRVLLDPDFAGMSEVCELLLYAAARAQLVDACIRPALARGDVVICDRFADSTTAYQGAGRGIDREMIGHLHRLATRTVWPDLTLLIDVPVAVGLARTQATRELDRIEREPTAFHEAVRQGFLAIAQAEPDRVRIIDGAGAPDDVAAEVDRQVDALLGSTRRAGDRSDA